jgi:uncharacterized protein YndB with AHSA1/START domain
MRKVEVIENIKAKPEAVIAAFTDAEMLREWWGVQRTFIDKRPGGLYLLAWNISDQGFGFISTGTIKEYQDDTAFTVDNFVYLHPDKPILGCMTLTVKVREKNNETELYLCQDGYQNGTEWDWYYEAVKQAWPTVIKTLKNYLEKKNAL